MIFFFKSTQWRIQDLWKGRAGNAHALMPRQAWKVDGGGGIRHFFVLNFFATFTLWGGGTIRLPDTNLCGEKQKKKGGTAADSPPPPPDPTLQQELILSIHYVMYMYILVFNSSDFIGVGRYHSLLLCVFLP